MKRQTKHILALSAAAIALVAITATASALITSEVNKEPERVVKPVAKANNDKIRWNDPAPQQPAPQVASNCDDGNIVGYGLGALGGGLIGNQIGDGKGKDVATIGGAAAGALAGGKFIPTRNVLCPK